MTALRDWVHPIAEIGERTIVRERKATAEERVELSRELDILSCDSLDVTYEIKPLGKERYRFEGKLEAAVTQACVVTLEPVPASLSEAFSIKLGPPEELDDAAPVAGDREVSSIPDVEPIEDGRIEAGALIYAVMSAALDPYPRKADASFDWVDPKMKDDPGPESPFAALSKLKPKS